MSQPRPDNLTRFHLSGSADNTAVRTRDNAVTPIQGCQRADSMQAVYQPFQLLALLMGYLMHPPAQLFPEEPQAFPVQSQQLLRIEALGLTGQPCQACLSLRMLIRRPQ